MRYISVFSGIEAASVAFYGLGWEPMAFSEVDEFPCAVLAHRFPHVPNLGDICKVDWKPYRGRVDLVVGGSPCQSFSIAGKREGLQGESGLMFEFIRCVREVRPRWFLWENVPGALSSERGAAFGQLLHELADGGVTDAHGACLMLSSSEWPSDAAVSFLSDVLETDSARLARYSLSPTASGNSASSRAKRAELAAGAGRGAQGAGFGGPSGHQREHRLPAGAGADTLKAGSNKASTGCVISVAANQRGEVRLDGGDGQTMGAIPATRSGKQLQGVLTPWDVQSKRVYSQDACGPTLPSGTSEGVNIQPSVLCMASGQANAEVGEDVGTTLSARQYKDPPIAAVTRCGCEGGGKGALTSEDVSLTLSTRNEQSLFDPQGGPRYVVRRLTPVECERLQGFPDGWTQVPYRGRAAGECPDGPRYKAIGNSMAVPVMRWIGKRMQEVDDA